MSFNCASEMALWSQGGGGTLGKLIKNVQCIQLNMRQLYYAIKTILYLTLQLIIIFKWFLFIFIKLFWTILLAILALNLSLLMYKDRQKHKSVKIPENPVTCICVRTSHKNVNQINEWTYLTVIQLNLQCTLLIIWVLDLFCVKENI